MSKFMKHIFVGLSVFSTTVSFSQPLEYLLKEVVDQNPDLKALYAEFEAEKSRIDQVSQLPNPTLSSGFPVLRPETRLGPQLVMVSASQMFPWFGALKSKEEVVISMSNAKFERIAAKKLELFYLLKTAYYKIDFETQKLGIIEESLKIYRSLENIALAKVESGQTLTSDVLRIHLKIQELDTKIPEIRNEISSVEVQINQLTNHALSRSITTENGIDSIEPLEFDTAIYMNRIRAHHPMIVALNFNIEASENKQVVNRKSNGLMFGVGVDYSVVGERTDANPIGNGQDILIPKVMFNIPLYRKSYKAKDQEENFIQESLKYQKESFLDMVLARLLQYKLEYDNALHNMELHQNLYVTTQQALDILLVNYSSTGKGFDEVLQLENELLSHNIAIIKYKLESKIAVAKIERYTDF